MKKKRTFEQWYADLVALLEKRHYHGEMPDIDQAEDDFSLGKTTVHAANLIMKWRPGYNQEAEKDNHERNPRRKT